MFYELIANTELVDTKIFLLRLRFLGASGHNMFVKTLLV